MVVAIGAFVMPPAVVGGILAALGVAEGGISPNEVSTAGIGLVIAQFLAYFWGGYTSGRMARGSGVMNGILVPIVAIILVVILGAVVAVATSSATDLRPSD